VIYRLAKRYDGVLTVSDVVSELDIEPGEAEALLQRLTDGQRVDMDVDHDGVIRYVFRELTP
jgi:Mn-dependent DtxR family transcriptional regulator